MLKHLFIKSHANIGSVGSAFKDIDSFITWSDKKM